MLRFMWLVLSPPGAPDKRRLMTVQEFFQYSEKEGVMLARPDGHRLACAVPTVWQSCIWPMQSAMEG